jgi:AcrR family transcriptional regulator
MAGPLSRRDRLRSATVHEIKDTARSILVEHGPTGLTLRAIARQMGMSAPALYRYFPSREELLEDLIRDLYDEVSDVMEKARDALPDDDAAGRLVTVSRAFRDWAVSHRAEFALLFGSPIEGVQRTPLAGSPDQTDAVGAFGAAADGPKQRFGAVFAGLIAQLYLTRPFPIPDDAEIEPRLRSQLNEWCKKFPVPMPDGVTQIFLSCWIRLYGIVSMEVFGHLGFALYDVEPMFEAEMRELSEMLCIADDYRPPPSG